MSSPTRRTFIAAVAASLAAGAGVALTVTTGLTAAVPIGLGLAATWLWLTTAVRAEHEQTRRFIAEQKDEIRRDILAALDTERQHAATAEGAARAAAELFDTPPRSVRPAN